MQRNTAVAIREVTLSLAAADTYTAVPFWLNLSLIELIKWVDIVSKLNKKKERQ